MQVKHKRLAQTSSATNDSSWVACVQAHKLVPPEAPSTAALVEVDAAGLSQSLANWAFSHHLNRLLDVLPPLLSSSTSATVPACIENAHALVNNVHACLAAHETFLPREQSIVARFHTRLSAKLPAAVSNNFPVVVFELLHEHLIQAGASNHMPAPPVVSQLVSIGLASVAQNALSWAIANRMDVLVSARGARNDRILPDLLLWVNQSVAPVVAALHPDAAVSWPRRLLFRLHQAVCDVRTNQLLQLIRSFPQSRPALDDLRDAILATDRKPFVAAALRDQFRSSVLNAGTNTERILHQYVSMIRTLRFLDPSGLIVDVVSRPILDYLRRRPDTVRCIVAGMTGDGDLYKELERGRRRRRAGHDESEDTAENEPGPISSQQMNASAALLNSKHNYEDDVQSVDGDLNEELCFSAAEFEAWKPMSSEAPRGDGVTAGGDAIATLVTIYGSSEHIVDEYRAALADKLLNSFDIDLLREERVLALLSDRFGCDAMHYCSIMSRDVTSSRDHIKRAHAKHGESLKSFDATVISKECWPTLADEGEFSMPPAVQEQMDMFTKFYERGVGRRKLKWQHGLGVVQIRLRFDDGRERTMCVSPMQAAILEQFADSARLTLKELKTRMEVKEESVLRRKLQGLSSLGLLRSVDSRGETYETVEDGNEVSGVADDDHIEGEMDDTDAAAASEAAEMAVYESYVMAMLQNLKQLPLEQIHTMLQRFVQTPVYDKTQSQLAAFLGTLIDSGKVEVAAGVYRVKKK